MQLGYSALVGLGVRFNSLYLYPHSISITPGPHFQSSHSNCPRYRHNETAKKGSEDYGLENSLDYRGSTRHTTSETIRLGKILRWKDYSVAEGRIRGDSKLLVSSTCCCPLCPLLFGRLLRIIFRIELPQLV